MANTNPTLGTPLGTGGTGVFDALARKGSVSTTQPPRHTALRQAAESLSRRNVDMAIVELYMECMQRLTQLAYETSEGTLCNVDSVTHRFLIAVPWGRNGHQRWGLSRSEGIVLREMIQTRQAQTDSRPPGLFLYDRTRRSWRVSFFDYDTLQDAQAYWQRYPLSVQQYRDARSRRGMSAT
jgi:hypothetical protein